MPYVKKTYREVKPLIDKFIAKREEERRIAKKYGDMTGMLEEKRMPVAKSGNSVVCFESTVDLELANQHLGLQAFDLGKDPVAEDAIHQERMDQGVNSMRSTTMKPVETRKMPRGLTFDVAASSSKKLATESMSAVRTVSQNSGPIQPHKISSAYNDSSQIGFSQSQLYSSSCVRFKTDGNSASQNPFSESSIVKFRGSALSSISSVRSSYWERLHDYTKHYSTKHKFIFRRPVSRAIDMLKKNRILHFDWLEKRLDISSRSHRFELPMDVLEFTDMTQMEYLIRYCVVSTERENVYKALFNKNAQDVRRLSTGKMITEKMLSYTPLKTCLMNILSYTVELTKNRRRVNETHWIFVEESDIKIFIYLAGIETSEGITFAMFRVLAALAERILCSSLANIPSLKRTPDPRSFLEQADFAHLLDKLKDVQFNCTQLKRILFSLR